MKTIYIFDFDNTIAEFGVERKRILATALNNPSEFKTIMKASGQHISGEPPIVNTVDKIKDLIAKGEEVAILTGNPNRFEIIKYLTNHNICKGSMSIWSLNDYESLEEQRTFKRFVLQDLIRKGYTVEFYDDDNFLDLFKDVNDLKDYIKIFHPNTLEMEVVEAN